MDIQHFDNDWRITNQNEYLTGKVFSRSTWKSNNPDNDHDHCEFCLEKIGNDGLTIGFCTDDFYHWICESCFSEFSKR